MPLDFMQQRFQIAEKHKKLCIYLCLQIINTSLKVISFYNFNKIHKSYGNRPRDVVE